MSNREYQRDWETGTHLKYIGIRLTEEQMIQLRKWAKKRKLAISVLARQIIFDVLDAEDGIKN